MHIDPACYDHDGLQGEIPTPLPLGRMARRLDEIATTGVAIRSIDFYAALASDIQSDGSDLSTSKEAIR